MYNKLFTKILDSSIWMTPMPTRIVWITFLAIMDEDGYVALASAANVAHRARVTFEEAESAIAELSSPEFSTETELDDGTRIERVPGGWIVLNAPKYREMATREQIKESGRLRTQRWREGKRGGDAYVTPRDANVTQSDTDTDTKKRESRVFHAPSLEECEVEMVRIGLQKVEGAKFFNHHEARGWMLGKLKMKSWKAACQTWKSNFDKFAGSPAGGYKLTPARPLEKNIGWRPDPLVTEVPAPESLGKEIAAQLAQFRKQAK